MVYSSDALIISSMMPFLTIAIILLFIHSIFSGSKTRQYRRKLADMYVAGKIRQLAEKEGIKIQDELKEFILFTKHEKKFMQDLDEAIETDMKYKIVEDSKDTKKQ